MMEVDMQSPPPSFRPVPFTIKRPRSPGSPTQERQSVRPLTFGKELLMASGCFLVETSFARPYYFGGSVCPPHVHNARRGNGSSHDNPG